MPLEVTRPMLRQPVRQVNPNAGGAAWLPYSWSWWIARKYDWEYEEWNSVLIDTIGRLRITSSLHGAGMEAFSFAGRPRYGFHEDFYGSPTYLGSESYFDSATQNLDVWKARRDNVWSGSVDIQLFGLTLDPYNTFGGQPCNVVATPYAYMAAPANNGQNAYSAHMEDLAEYLADIGTCPTLVADTVAQNLSLASLVATLTVYDDGHVEWG